MIEVEEEILTNPFPGLRPFEEDEDYLFFGREKQIDDLLKKLSATRFLAVVGTSGSGKSSLVKCGLLPSLYSGFMTRAGSNWKITVFRPGSDPIGNMADALAQPNVLYDEESMEIPFKPIIAATLKRSRLGLVEAIKQSELSPDENLLIVVDQFEELFRFSKYEKRVKEGARESSAFINLLLTASRQKEIPIYVVFTMRSDFLGDCTAFRGLPEAINDGQYLIPRMMREEIKMAITGPIAVGGAEITPRLLTRLLNDVGDNPDQLPILQHALSRTWHYWQHKGNHTKALDIDEYVAIGTMSQALSQHGEEAYAELDTDHAKKVCEILFKTITEKGTSVSGIRRPTKLKEICHLAETDIKQVVEVIEVFRKPERPFLMPPVGVEINEDSIIDISHESLMRVWGRLIDWVEDEAQSAENYMRLAEAAALYQEGKSGLWRDPELEISLKWRQRNAPNKVWAQMYERSFERAMNFLDYCKSEQDFELAQKEKQQKRALRRTRISAIILGSTSVVSLLFLLLALDLKSKSEISAQEALEARDTAETERKDAESQKLRADSLRIKADNAQEIAEYEKAIAESRKTEAELEKNKAFKAKNIAEIAFKDADNQKRIALIEKRKSDSLTIEAEDSESRVYLLRLLATSRSLAIQSSRKYKNNKDLGALLALQAYQLNKDNGGDKFNPDIFNALAQVADERLQFRGHTDGVRAIAVSNDGQTIASGSDDGTVRIWNINKPDEKPWILKSDISLYKNVMSVAFSTGDKYIAAGDADGAIFLWDLTQKNTPPKILKGHEAGVNSVCFDQKTKFIFSASSDGTIRIWNLNQLSSPPVILGQIGGRVMAISLAPDGKMLASASEDKIIRLYDIPNQTKIRELTGHAKATNSVSFSHDSRYLASGSSNGTVLIWDTKTPSSPPFHLAGHRSGISSIEFSNSGNLVATGSLDGTIRLWNHNKLDAEPIVLRGHDLWVWGLAFTPDGTKLVSASADKTIRTWATKPEILAGKICDKVTRNLSLEEWNHFVGEDVPYGKTCKNLPAGQ